MQAITSRDNPGFKQLRALCHNSRERKQLNQTVLDGAHLLAAYLAHGHTPRGLWVSEAAQANAEIAALIGAQRAPVFVVSEALLREAAPTDTPSGLLAVIDIPAPRIAGPGSVLVLDGVQDAGNVGTLLRTAAAAGLSAAWLAPGCASAWSPRVLRAGMGAQFSVPVLEHADVTALLQNFQGRVVATALGAGGSLFELDLRGPVAWVFGAEGAGVSARLMAQATDTVAIPMPGDMESLNVAAAAAVCLFEQVRQRQAVRP